MMPVTAGKNTAKTSQKDGPPDEGRERQRERFPVPTRPPRRDKIARINRARRGSWAFSARSAPFAEIRLTPITVAAATGIRGISGKTKRRLSAKPKA